MCGLPTVSRKFIIDQIGHTAASVGQVAKRTNAIRAAQDDLIMILSGKQTKPKDKIPEGGIIDLLCYWHLIFSSVSSSLSLFFLINVTY